MKRQFINLKEHHMQKSLQKLQKLDLNPLRNSPVKYSEKMQNLQLLSKLKPKDPYGKNLPPHYQADLDSAYQNYLSRAIS